MRRVAPRVAPKLKVLIPIKPAGASTKSTYVGAGAGACVRIDWIGFSSRTTSTYDFLAAIAAPQFLIFSGPFYLSHPVFPTSDTDNGDPKMEVPDGMRVHREQ